MDRKKQHSSGSNRTWSLVPDLAPVDDVNYREITILQSAQDCSELHEIIDTKNLDQL